jgi:hypothetical protein
MSASSVHIATWKTQSPNPDEFGESGVGGLELREG